MGSEMCIRDSYWSNEYGEENTQIDVMAVDTQHKILFAGECKYHTQPVDADVYFDLRKKVESSAEIRKVFGDYRVLYGVFSKSGFTSRLLELCENPELILIQEDTMV